MSLVNSREQSNINDNDPYQSFKQGSSHIVWGTHPNKKEAIKNLVKLSIIEKIRHELIEENYRNKGSPIRSLGTINVTDNTKSASCLKCLRLTVQSLKLKNTFTVIMNQLKAIFASFVTVSFSIIYLETVILPQRYPKMKDLFWIRSAEVLISLFNVGIAFRYIFGRGSFFSEYKKIQQIQGERFIVLQDLKKTPISMNSVILNSTSEQGTAGYIDPISLMVIPKDEIKSAKIINVGNYIFSIENALMGMFRNNLKNSSEIPHPVEDRFLTHEEQKKFLENVCSFFCLTNSNDLLNCWKYEVKNIPEKYQGRLNGIKRMTVFLTLLPKTNVRHFFKALMAKEIDYINKNLPCIFYDDFIDSLQEDKP
ncbi:MAG: hypothetical protein H0W88_03565 [Parachlamydiaceae bacterium]|nr:hypothetical protein [Parachlamydiaceae bacterium]